MRDVMFHEDDYCQLELVAEANGSFCAQQMGLIEDFSKAHATGAGWTDMFVRQENPTPLSSLGITRSAFSGAIPAVMPKFDSVATGYGSYRTDCTRTVAFGPHAHLVIYAEYDDKDVMTAIWFTFDVESEGEVENAMEVLRGLSRWPLALADWGWSQLIRLGDAEGLSRYLHERRKVFGAKN
jgi:hypothetical protein